MKADDRVTTPSGAARVLEVRGNRALIEYENPDVFKGTEWPTMCWERLGLLNPVADDFPVIPTLSETD